MNCGKYITKAGSIVKIFSLKNPKAKEGLCYEIDFDWLEENACLDACPSVNPNDDIADFYLHWGCDCHECGCHEFDRETHTKLYPIIGHLFL